MRYLWNIDEFSNVVCLVDLVHVQFAPDKLFLFVHFFEQTLFLELFSASEYLIIKILYARDPRTGIHGRFWFVLWSMDSLPFLFLP